MFFSPQNTTFAYTSCIFFQMENISEILIKKECVKINASLPEVTLVNSQALLTIQSKVYSKFHYKLKARHTWYTKNPTLADFIQCLGRKFLFLKHVCPYFANFSHKYVPVSAFPINWFLLNLCESDNTSVTYFWM